MATIKKVSKAKNLSAGPSKKSPRAGMVDPKGAYTKVQKRTLGSMKTGGMVKKKVMKAQNGETLPNVTVTAKAAEEEKGPSLKERIFGTKEERQERRGNRQTNRAVRRSERAAMPRCTRSGCGGRGMGFSGYNKNGGKTSKKK